MASWISHFRLIEVNFRTAYCSPPKMGSSTFTPRFILLSIRLNERTIFNNNQSHTTKIILAYAGIFLYYTARSINDKL